MNKLASFTLTALLLAPLTALHAAEKTVTISNTEPRRDTQGEILDAHDGCLEYFDGQFYLYGTRYGKTDGFGISNRYVCYSSPDLTTWTAHGEDRVKEQPAGIVWKICTQFHHSYVKR